MLEQRNETLARFWMQEQSGAEKASAETTVAETVDDAGRRVRITVINAEDDFTGMLAHQLIRLGYEVEVLPWSALSALDATDPATAELLLVGPGPGDPNDLSDPRILALHRLVKTRLAAAAPMLGICLGHQIISVELGLRVERLAVPDQAGSA